MMSAFNDINCSPSGMNNFRLHLRFFGLVSITDAMGSEINVRGRKARAILAYLALTPGQVLREALANLLWSRVHREQGRVSLRHSIYEIQSSLQDKGEGILNVQKHYLELNQNAIKSDVRGFMNATLDQPEGLKLQTGALLEDLYGVDSAFDEWIKSERRRIDLQGRRVAEDVLAKSIVPERLIIASEYIIQNDITAESAWRCLIRGHTELGNLEAVESTYQRCRTVLGSVADDVRYNRNYTLAASTQNLPIKPLSRDSVASDISHVAGSATVRFAILRFLPSDPGSERLAIALSEEIASALVQFRNISCLTPNDPSTYVYDTGLFRRLGVGFAVGGRIYSTKSGVNILINLIDVSKGGEIIWSQTFSIYNGIESDVPADTAAQIVAQIDSRLNVSDIWKTQSSGKLDLSSIDLVRSAIPLISTLQRRRFGDAGPLLATAIEKDPSNAAAHAWYAYWNLLLLGQGWSDNPSQTEALTEGLAKRAVALDPGDARALALAGHVQAFIHRRLDEAMILHERALAINPNLPIAWLFSGLAMTYAGHHVEAIRQISQAKKLSPMDSHGYFFDMGLTLSYSLSGDDLRAIIHGRNAAEINPEFSSTFKAYLSALGFAGSPDAITRVRHHLIALEPGFTVSTAMRRSPLARAEDRQKFANGLKRGGLAD